MMQDGRVGDARGARDILQSEAGGSMLRHAGFRGIQDQALGVFRAAADTFELCGQCLFSLLTIL
jgi:hypothetical protein